MRPAAAEARPRGGREAILAAAAALFANKGFRGTTITDIAKAAGVNRALVSYHFGSKAGLYSELLTQAVDDAAAMLQRLRSEEPGISPEVQLIRAFATVYRTNPHLAPMLVREHLNPEFLLTAAHAEKLRAFSEMTRTALDRIELRAKARDYDPQIVHLICVGALIYFIITRPFRERMQAKLEPPSTRPSLDEFADVLAALVGRGLRD